jgi:hypothetical protein
MHISANVPASVIRELAPRFLLREIAIVRPSYIFALGLKPLYALKIIGVLESTEIMTIRLPHPAARWSRSHMLSQWRDALRGVRIV